MECEWKGKNALRGGGSRKEMKRRRSGSSSCESSGNEFCWGKVKRNGTLRGGWFRVRFFAAQVVNTGPFIFASL